MAFMKGAIGLNELLVNETIVLASMDQNFTLDLTGLVSA